MGTYHSYKRWCDMTLEEKQAVMFPSGWKERQEQIQADRDKRGVRKQSIKRDMRLHARMFIKESCEDCSSKDNLHVHHIHPLGKGGGNDKENLKTVCKPCHRKLHPELPDKMFS